MTDQLALQVDPSVEVSVLERRGADERTVRLGPLPQPQALELAALLLNRTEPPAGPGPWRLAIAGGVRVVELLRR